MGEQDERETKSARRDDDADDAGSRLARLQAQVDALIESRAAHEAAVETAVREAARELGRMCVAELVEARKERERVLRAVAELREERVAAGSGAGGAESASALLLPPVLLPPPKTTTTTKAAVAARGDKGGGDKNGTAAPSSLASLIEASAARLRVEFEAALHAAVAEMSRPQLAQAEAVDAHARRIDELEAAVARLALLAGAASGPSDGRPALS